MQSSSQVVDSPTAHDHHLHGGSPLRKSFLPPNHSAVAASSNITNNNNLNTINQHLNNLGTINHQLNTLQQQLSGLNHQSQTLQKFGASNANIFGQLYPINNMSSVESANPQQQHQQQQHADTFQANQELLHRLQCLTLGLSGQSTANVSPLNNNSFAGTSSPAGGSNPSASAAFMFANANANASATLNRSSNHLFPQNIGNGNLTPSPIMNRSLYTASPSMFDTDSLGVSMERNLDRNSGSSGTGTACNSRNSPFIRPLSQQPSVATLTSVAGGVDCHTPLPSAFADASRSARDAANQRSQQQQQRPSDFVQLQVTDESGNVRKMSSATPANITRTTSEKAPQRSQLMSEVQRTTWARHTTK